MIFERTIDSHISTPTFLTSLASKGGQNLIKVFDYSCIRPNYNPLKVSNLLILYEFWGFLIRKKLKFNQNWPNLSQISYKSPSDTRRKRIVSIELSYKTMAKLVSLQLELYHSLYYNKNWKMVKKCFDLMIERTVGSQMSTPTFLTSWASKGGQNLTKVFD